MAEMKTLTVNGQTYTVQDPDAAHIEDGEVSKTKTWSSEKINSEIVKKSKDLVVSTVEKLGITCDAAGEVISVADASALPVRGLTLYGKTNQDGIPTPETPVDLVSVGHDGNVGVTICGKNLFDPKPMKNYGFAENNGVYSGNVANLMNMKTNIAYKKNTQYTVSFYSKGSEKGDIALFVWFKYTDGTGSKAIQTSPSSTEKFYSLTSGVGKTVSDIAFSFGNGQTIWLWNFQVEEGTTATAYEPYNSTTLTASTHNGLPGIPVTSGGNYTDENGQQWICDELDYAEGVLIKRTHEIEFDGNTKGKRMSYTDAQNDGSTSVYAYITQDQMPYELASHTKALCNYFIYNSGLTTNSVIALSFRRELLGLESSVTDRVAITEAVNTRLKEYYDSGKPLRVIYQLATPIKTPLSTEELAQLATLHTNKPNTTVYNDSGAHMALEYTADTKAYIDSKFAELAAAMMNS